MAQENPEMSFSPKTMLAYANKAIYEASAGKIMMTFFAAVMDFSHMTLSYSSAGHNPPWLFTKTASGGYEMKSLIAKGIRLGELPNMRDFEEHSLDLRPNDLLFMYTDGVTEGRNQLGAMFGKKALRKVVEASLVGGPELVISNISKEFKKHNEGKPLDDDITLAAVQVLSF